MRRNIGDFNVVLTDMTAAEGVLAVMGPKARDLMRKVSPNDFSNATNPFGTAQEIEIGMGAGPRPPGFLRRGTRLGGSTFPPTWPRMCSRCCERRGRMWGSGSAACT